MAVFEGNFSSSIPLRFAIIISRFNDLVSERLLAGCQDCLKRHGVDPNPQGTQVDYVWVPGSFEVAMIAHQAALSHRYDAVICLGAVIRGQTPHFDYVAAEVSKGIAAAAFQTGVPVIYGILTVDTMQQALERAGIKSNKGWDYALNALEMASLMRQFKTNGLASANGAYDSAAVTNQTLPLPSNRAIVSESTIEHTQSSDL